MIKKSIFWLFITLWLTISFSSAVSYIWTWVDDNSVVNQYWFFNTTIWWQNKPFLKGSVGALSLWQWYFWNNDKLYCFKWYSNIEYQWYIWKVWVCYFTWSNFTSCNFPTNFWYSDYDSNVVWEFLKWITYWDFWETGFQWTNDTPRLTIYDNDTYVSMNFICWNDFVSSYWDIYNLWFQTWNLIQNFNWFESLDSSYMWNPPWYWWTNNRERNNNNYYCPTIWQILKNYGENYNTWLCYNSTIRYDNGQITTVEKQDIFTTFENYNDFTNRTSIYNNNCGTPNTVENCQNAFSWQREKYSIIANAINNNVRIKDLWNYCNMSLNYDPNWSTCTASGYIAEQPTEDEFIEMIIEWEITKISTPWNWNILNNILGTWQTRDDIATRDILWQLNQLKEKIGSIFNERNGTDGIIPDYIMWLILTTLLLTVLLKK